MKQEIPCCEPIELVQIADSFRVQYALQPLGRHSFDEHEHLDLSELDARDSFLRCPMAIRHGPGPYSSDGSEAFDS